MSKDQITREFKRAHEEHLQRSGGYSYQFQKDKLLELSWQLYIEDTDVTAAEAIEEAHDFLEQYRLDVINVSTRKYFT